MAEIPEKYTNWSFPPPPVGDGGWKPEHWELYILKYGLPPLVCTMCEKEVAAIHDHFPVPEKGKCVCVECNSKGV